MDLVIDANILFAALVKQSFTADLLFKSNLRLYAPEFIFVEFEKYKNVLKNKTEMSDKGFDKFLAILKRRITTVPKVHILPFIPEAKLICPDGKDVPYFALAIKLNASLWSNDKALKEKQDVIKVYSTKDVSLL